MDTEFLTKENDFVEALGVSIAQLKDVRRDSLEEGLHWKRKGNTIWYSEIGKKKAGEVFGCQGVDFEKKGAGGSLDEKERRDLFVYRKVRNPKILMAVADFEDLKKNGGVAVMRVRVKDSERFVPGMRLPLCRHVQEDLWMFEGRMPNSKVAARVLYGGGI